MMILEYLREKMNARKISSSLRKAYRKKKFVQASRMDPSVFNSIDIDFYSKWKDLDLLFILDDLLPTTCRARYLEHASPSVRIENPPRLITESFLKLKPTRLRNYGLDMMILLDSPEKRRTVHDYSCLHIFGQLEDQSVCLRTNTRERVLDFVAEKVTARFHEESMVPRMARYYSPISSALDYDYVDLLSDERLFIQLGVGNQKTYFPKPVVRDVVVYYFVFQRITTVSFEFEDFGEIQSCIRNVATFMVRNQYPYLPSKVTIVTIPLWQKIVMKEFILKVWPRQRERKKTKHILYGFSHHDLFILRLPRFILREHILPFC